MIMDRLTAAAAECDSLENMNSHGNSNFCRGEGSLRTLVAADPRHCWFDWRKIVQLGCAFPSAHPRLRQCPFNRAMALMAAALLEGQVS